MLSLLGSRRGKDSGVDVRLDLLEVDVGFHPVPAGSIGENEVLVGEKMVGRSARNSSRTGFAFLARRTAMVKKARGRR